MGRTPLLIPMLAMIGGTLMACFLPAHAAAISVLTLMATVCIWLTGRHTVAIALLFFTLGAVNLTVRRTEAPELHGRPCEYTGLMEEIREQQGVRRAMCMVDGVGPVAMRIYGSWPIFEPGDSVSFTARLQPAERDSVIVPDEIVYNADEQAVAECGLSASAITVTARSPQLRQRIIGMILSWPVSDRTGALLCALLPGHTRLLSAAERSEFSEAGLSHVLALSGLHVGVITMLIGVALWPLYVGRHNRTRRLLTIVLLWCFAAITGFSPSVTRAVIMATVYLTGLILERRGVPMNSLFFAAMVIVGIWPDAMFTVSFQLSFAAVAGILLFYPLINRVNRREHPWLYLLASYPAVSIAAMAFTGPVAAYYFHGYPLYFLLANLAVAPLLPLLIGAGVLALAADAIGLPFGALCMAMDYLAGAIGRIASVVSSLPGHAVSGLYFPSWLLAGVIASLLLLAHGGHTRRPAPLLAAVMAICLTVQIHALTRQEFPVCESFMLADKSATNMLIRQNHELYLLTSASASAQRTEELRHATERFTHYMAKRNLPALTLLPDTIFTPYVSRRGNHFSIGGVRYALLTDNDAAPLMRIDYLIVSKGFTGNVADAARAFAPDSAVILSSALHRKRRERYARELTSENITYKII